MHKPFLKKPLFLAALLALAFAVLTVGGIALSSSAAHAASASKQDKVSSPWCVKKGSPACTTFEGVITQINDSTITLQSKSLTRTIHLTAKTAYLKASSASKGKPKATQPASQSDLRVGETVDVNGTLDSDGSVTAAAVVIFV
jgi:hypothetical protein